MPVQLVSEMYRLLRSTSAFLQTKLLYRRPTPLIFVKAYMTFCLPSTCDGCVSAVSSYKQSFPWSSLLQRTHCGDRDRRTLVLSRRKMNWKFDFSPETSDIFAADGLVCGEVLY